MGCREPRRRGRSIESMRDRLRHALLIAAAVSGVAIFIAFAFYERPGLGLGHFYYVSIILAALATGPAIGAGAAGLATVLFAIGVVINPQISPSEVLTTSTVIRFLTYMTVGMVTGYFAKRNRLLLADLELLAERDALTGLPNTRVFERAIGDLLERDQPFALIVGGVHELAPKAGRTDIDADDVLRRVATRLMPALSAGDQVVRVGEDAFAVLTYAGSSREAGKIAAHLQSRLAADGFTVTFGWAAYPQDGSNALSLYRAADERLYARRLIHRQTTVVPLQGSATSS
ncbi:MAG: GGDEF domain-containing protein [Actinobacteria bacterium]|nr:MAG: GGDEF domain-containing protein [Actinomycetota bacterium]